MEDLIENGDEHAKIIAEGVLEERTPSEAGPDVSSEARMQDRLREVELEATLRFGAREMTLGEVLDLGPGDVIELDRQVQDAVDLLVGDKIVARGIAVLTEGRYGLRITEVAETRPTLESVRCLF